VEKVKVFQPSPHLKRYFHLNPQKGTLTIRNSDREIDSVKHVIKFREFIKVTEAKLNYAADLESPWKYVFLFHTSQRPYRLYAKTPEEKFKWMTSI